MLNTGRKLIFGVILMFIGMLVYDALVAPKAQLEKCEEAKENVVLELVICEKTLTDFTFEDKWQRIAKNLNKKETHESNTTVYLDFNRTILF